MLLDIWRTVNLNGLERLDLIFVFSAAFALPLPWLFISWYWHSKTRNPNSNPRVLHALSAFVTPTSCASILNNNSASILKNTKIFKSYLIELDLSDLIDSICTGKAELRDSSDLHDLFREKLRLYGWHFGLLVGRNWSFRISRWIIAHHAYGFLKPSTISIQPGNARATYHHSTYPLDLDFVPFHMLEKKANEIQSSLQSGSTTILEFSCLAPGVRFMSRDFILCAVPFLLRTYRDSKDALKYSRTTAPLLTRFNTVVALLSSSESSTIRSIGNISRWHAHSLLQLEEKLSNDISLRTTCVQEEGIAGWREKKFMLAWEAGLLRAGFLTRWRVVLVK